MEDNSFGINTVLRDRFRGCLLGGAVGDALGAPVEFMRRREILVRFGSQGIQEYIPAYGRLGAVTDDTQMTLFTAEGLLRAQVRQVMRGICHPPDVISFAYQRWLHTQGVTHPLQAHCMDGWLVQQRELHSRRAPGHTCMSALQAMTASTTLARNDSKGCGGVMRVAPIGMIAAAWTLPLPSHDKEQAAAATADAFDLACRAAAITHGHPSGQLASGAFASIVMSLLLDVPLRTAIEAALLLLERRESHHETSLAVRHALRLGIGRPRNPGALAELGEGWIAEEALAISLYCALGAQEGDFRNAVALAVNHDGDSDSTGSMVGQLLGVIHGARAIPASWLDPLELRDVIERMADDLVVSGAREASPQGFSDDYLERYPGA